MNGRVAKEIDVVKLKEQARSTGDETNEKHSLTKVKATKVERKIKFINKQKLN